VAAKFLMEKARGYIEKRRLDVALPMLAEIVRRYGKTEAAVDAAVLLEKLNKAAAAEGRLPPDRVLAARKWLIIGDIHADNGRPDKAAASYRRVIHDFAGSRYAQQAREKIAAITKDRN
jgi:outer membrane protein assembly factor BamD (BamD/ComL family)